MHRCLAPVAGLLLAATAVPADAQRPGRHRQVVPPPVVTCPEGPLTSLPAADSAAERLALIGTQREDRRPGEFRSALAQARRAIEAQPGNAYGYYLAGQAALGVDDFAEAERMLDEAVRICPAIAAEDVEGYRAMAAGQAYETAGPLLAAGDTAGAIAAYEASLRLHPGNYPAEFYLGLIAFQRENTAQSVTYWRRMIETIDALPQTEEEAVRAERLSARANAFNALVFAARQYLQGGQIAPATNLLLPMFDELPNNAEVAYFLAHALNSQQRWAELLPVAERATQLAPLNYSSWLLLYNAYAGQAQTAGTAGDANRAVDLGRRARTVSERGEQLPLQLEGITVDVTPERTEIRGVAVGTGGTAPLTIEFTLHGFEGVLGSGRVTITPPAGEEHESFSLDVENTYLVTGVTYRVVEG
jgi:tetratricopeptide (TPR) repeat protein